MAGLANWWSQIWSVTGVSLSTIPERRGSSLAAVFGIAGVVAVLIGVLSIAHGFRRTMQTGGDPDMVLIMRSGSDSEMMSILGGEEVRLLASTPGIAQGTEGPLASGELFVVINLPKRSTGTDANVPLRGIQPPAFEVRRDIQMIEGRRFEWGRNEVIVGQGAAREFAGLDVGEKIKVGRNEWEVVGRFSARGGLSESEIWTDATVLQGAYQRGTSFQSMLVRLPAAAKFQEFKDTLTRDPRFNVKILKQSEYYAEQSKVVESLITGLGTLVASLMGIGAVFGALNTMYTAVSARTREIATLRALGFRAGPVVVSVLVEALLLAVAGALIGGLSAYLAFDGFRTATLNWQSFSQVAFAFEVSPALLLQGGIYAAVIGLVGGIFPAIRAARLPIARALREL